MTTWTCPEAGAVLIRLNLQTLDCLSRRQRRAAQFL